MIPAADGIVEPAPGVALMALPYDRDSVIAALAAQATSPRPDTRLLDSLFARFQKPFAAYAVASERTTRLQDSLTSLKASLDSLPREAPEYRQRYGAFVTLAAEHAAAVKQRDSLDQALKRARAAFGPASDSVRRALEAWENITYGPYEQVTGEIALHLALQPTADTTGADGSVTLELKRGRWWIYARTWDALDPNTEWYWNLPVEGDSLVLSPDNARRRTLY